MSEFCHLLDALWPCRLGATGRPYRYTRYVDVADLVSDFDEAFCGSDGLTRLGEVVQERTAAGQLREFAGERVGAPMARPHQILCIGLNYSDHAAETGAAVPDEPILFTKSPNTLIGPYDDVRIPRSQQYSEFAQGGSQFKPPF